MNKLNKIGEKGNDLDETPFLILNDSDNLSTNLYTSLWKISISFQLIYSTYL